MHSITMSLIAVALLAAPDVDKVDCPTAGEQYTTDVNKLIESIRAYEKCVSSGDKHNDCSAEMQAVDSAHDDFADAIADLKDCK